MSVMDFNTNVLLLVASVTYGELVLILTCHLETSLLNW